MCGLRSRVEHRHRRCIGVHRSSTSTNISRSSHIEISTKFMQPLMVPVMVMLLVLRLMLRGGERRPPPIVPKPCYRVFEKTKLGILQKRPCMSASHSIKVYLLRLCTGHLSAQLLLSLATSVCIAPTSCGLLAVGENYPRTGLLNAIHDPW